MNNKIDYDKEKENLLNRWFNEKQGLGMKRTSFVFLHWPEKVIRRCLRELRREGRIILSKKYLFMSDKTYSSIKVKTYSEKGEAKPSQENQA